MVVTGLEQFYFFCEVVLEKVLKVKLIHLKMTGKVTETLLFNLLVYN